MEVRKNILKSCGWHFLAKQCSVYCNCSFFLIMDMPAIEVAGIAALIQMETEYNRK